MVLTECRNDIRLCATLATAKHLEVTQTYNISPELKIDKHQKITELLDDSGKNPVIATPLFVSLKGPLHSGLKPGTIAGTCTRKFLQPLDWTRNYSPHVIRAMAASYKHAYGIDVDTCTVVGNWSDRHTFYKHYLRLPHPRVAAEKIDTTVHDWVTLRAHGIQSSNPNRAQGTAVQNTSNAEAIAAQQ